MMSKFTLSSKVGRINLSDIFRNITGSATIRLNSEPMVFLIEVNFPTETKIGTMLSKIKLNTRVNEVHGSSFLQKFSWFDRKLGLVCQTMRFFLASWIFAK